MAMQIYEIIQRDYNQDGTVRRDFTRMIHISKETNRETDDVGIDKHEARALTAWLITHGYGPDTEKAVDGEVVLEATA